MFDTPDFPATFAESRANLLPKTDRVALVMVGDDGAPHGTLIVDWDALHAVAGELMTPQRDGWPLRYRVTQFPDLDQLARFQVNATLH